MSFIGCKKKNCVQPIKNGQTVNIDIMGFGSMDFYAHSFVCVSRESDHGRTASSVHIYGIDGHDASVSALKTLAHGCNTRVWMRKTVKSAYMVKWGTRDAKEISSSSRNFLRMLCALNWVILKVTLYIIDDKYMTINNREWNNAADVDLAASISSEYRMIFVYPSFVNVKWLTDENSICCYSTHRVASNTVHSTMGWHSTELTWPGRCNRDISFVVWTRRAYQ